MSYLALFALLVALLSCCAAPSDAAPRGEASVASPDGRLRIRFLTVGPDGKQAASGQVAYEVTYKGRAVVQASRLGMRLEDGAVLGASVEIAGAKAGKVDETYTIPAGKSNPVRNRCNTVAVTLRQTAAGARGLAIEARAYDDGVAFRYVLPDGGPARIAGEATEFRLAQDATAWPLVLKDFRTPYEDGYRTAALSAMDPQWLVGLPLLTEIAGTAYVAITEADIDDYAGMYLSRSKTDPLALDARLAPRVDDGSVAVVTTAPARSPWRVLMVGDTPGRLIESTIVLNLNPPCAIADASWVKPGKAAWNWWSGSYAEGVSFRPGMNTATMKHYIDFASRAGFEYMMVDAGWAARRQGGGADITRTQGSFDMPAVIEHARQKKVGVWLWSHWTDVDRQIDEAFPLFEKWGVVGVKIDFMDRDDQQMVGFYRRVAKRAAEHHLMIDFHGAFKPDGLRRTYPNVITREGVMGLEYNRWSARITPDHNVMLPFTRMLAGPMDYTPGGFRNTTPDRFVARDVQPLVMGTRAHQLALFVVFESPFQMVSDYPEAYEGQPDFEFLRAVPSSWDETRVLNAKVGEYITIARRRGKEWYIGSLSGTKGADLEIPLDFLGAGNFDADLYSDAPDAAAEPTHTAITHESVTRATRLRTHLVTGGGQAIRIRPAG